MRPSKKTLKVDVLDSRLRGNDNQKHSLLAFYLRLHKNLGINLALMATHFTFPSHLLSTDGLSRGDTLELLALASDYYTRNQATDKKHSILKGRTLINLFFENSTRTRTSFELAGKRLGMDVINIAAANSSAKKGESLIDTAKTLSAMQLDALVIRHASSGAARLIAGYVACPVINAGDGSHQHPTQALLDAFTILHHKGNIEGLTVAICGDIAHSRVARSNLYLLQTLGAKVRLIAPPQLLPNTPEQFGAEIHYSMKTGLKDADVVMMLRVQTERVQGPIMASVREYFHLYGLDKTKLAFARPDALVLHPGPMNRGVEIASDVADDVERSGVLDQVEAGVAVRQAILESIVRS